MNLQFLRYFNVLACELHFGRAAEKLCITQSPLSAAIKSLEGELGVQLFLRSNKKVTLTREGEIFLIEAKSILEQTERAKRKVTASLVGLAGCIEVGLSPSLVYREVLDAVDAFTRENPKIEVNLHELPLSEQLDYLERGLIDIGFANAPAVPEVFNSWRLKDDVFAICVPSDHPKAKADSLTIEELSGEVFVMFSREIGPQNYTNVMSIFIQAGIHPRTVHRVRSWFSTLALVSKGAGVAIVPASMAKAKMGGVDFVPLAGAQPVAPAMMVWGADPHATTLRFVQCAKNVLEGWEGQ